MRHTTYLLFILVMSAGILFSSCEKDNSSNPVDAAFTGDFVSAVHTTSGTASIDQDGTTLTFTNFKTDSGPDLNIYLTSSLTNITSDFIDLGDIQGVDGNYTYSLPDSIDFTEYKYVIVWCVAFDVNFGYALLEMQ